MKIISIFFLFCVMLFAEPHKVYYYTTDKNIDNFKILKVNFDRYLTKYGDYEFQAFSDKEMFETFLKDNDTIVMLSSLHYKQISKKHNLNAVCVAQNKKSITDTNVIIGKKSAPLQGTLTTAFSKKYTKKLLRKTFGISHLTLLKVPKEIDALMSVGYGMSQFASVSKSSFKLLQKTNRPLTKDMRIYSESDPNYRMLVAVNNKNAKDKDFIRIFTNMNKSKNGKSILKILGIDNLVKLNNTHLRELRSVR
ncbi:MAG: hypothetical protein DRG09_04940 [Epsilonproteobacteria bacterium]|nr:MAG: hypothetical protein DRG09_04940 [Campylobacterota bacterium]